MIHGLFPPHFMALTIASCATLAYPVNGESIVAHTKHNTSTDSDSPRVNNTANLSLDQPPIMTTGADSVSYFAVPPPHNSPLAPSAPLMRSHYGSMDFPDHKPKMMAAGAGATGYQVLDEFGKETTVPFEGGLLNITNCNGLYAYGNKSLKLTKSLFLIPGETITITDTSGGTIFLHVCCTNCASINEYLIVPSGSISRIAERPDQCLTKLYCGIPSQLYLGTYTCFDNQRDGKDECAEFKGHAYDNYTGIVHSTMPGNDKCPGHPLKITYSKKNGTRINLVPGTLIMVTMENAGVQLYVKHKDQTSLFCKTVTKVHFYKYEINGTEELNINPEHLYKYEVNGTEEVTINPEQQLMVDGIVRVDCDIVIVNERANATTYFFIADGELKVNEKCKDGKPSCSVPAWVNEFINPVVINYAMEEGLTCTAQFTSCFPKITTETMMSTKIKTSNCTDTKSMEASVQNPGGKATTGFLLVTALAVVMLLLCIIIILGITFWFGINQSRTPSEVPETEKDKDEEGKKMSASGFESAAGHMDDVNTSEKNAAMTNPPLEEALKYNDKSVSVADAHNDKEDMVTARDTV